MAKITLAALQRRIDELEDGRQKTNIALGLYRTAGLDERLKKIEELKKYERQDSIGMAEINGVRKATADSEQKESDKLWHLVRTMIGDPLLEKECTIDQVGDRGEKRQIIETPFTNRRYY